MILFMLILERTRAHRTLPQRIQGELLRVRPELVAQFAAAHDASLWSCLCDIVNVAPDQCSASARDAATLPLCLGGLGLRSASRTTHLRIGQAGVADRFVAGLDGGVRTPALGSAVDGSSQSSVGANGGTCRIVISRQ